MISPNNISRVSKRRV